MLKKRKYILLLVIFLISLIGFIVFKFFASSSTKIQDKSIYVAPATPTVTKFPKR